MVTESAAAVVSTAVGTTVTYTASKPATFTASSVHDFFSHVSPFGRIGTGLTATGSPGATQQSFVAADVALLSAGNWVCLQDETVFPPLPVEMHPHLVSLILLELAATQMDQAAYSTRKDTVLDEMLSLLRGASNRADAQPKTVSLFHSPLARMIGRRGRRLVRS